MSNLVKPVTCGVCGFQSPFLGDHVVEAHGLSHGQYRERYPGSPLWAPELLKSFQESRSVPSREPAPEQARLILKVCGVPFPVNPDVPEEACLPCPPYYMVPTEDPLATDISHAATAIRKFRHVYIWGIPGVGKDAFVHFLSNAVRIPALLFSVKPGVDIQSWLYSRSFDQNGTSWEEGLLLKALRDGYTSPLTGRRIPYLILISDFDRADRAQAEYLRLITDSIQGRVEGPGGVTYPVFPGTRIVATANTMGAGDSRGRCISANPIDASILNRFERKFQFGMLDWKDEEKICRRKFPLLVEKIPEMFTAVGKAVPPIREKIANGELFAEFSHRDVCNWLGHAEDIIDLSGGKVPNHLIKKSAKAVLDGMPDNITRDAVKKIIDPLLKGGALPTGGRTASSDPLVSGI